MARLVLTEGGDYGHINIAYESGGVWTASTIDNRAANTEPRLEVDSEGRPHVMWQRVVGSSSTLIHGVLVDDTWVTTEGPDSTSWIDMDWGPDDTLHVVTREQHAVDQHALYTRLVCDGL